MEGRCEIKSRVNDSRIELNAGNSTFIPASIADYDVFPLTKQCKLLDSFIDNKDLSLSSKISRFLHITDK